MVTEKDLKEIIKKVLMEMKSGKDIEMKSKEKDDFEMNQNPHDDICCSDTEDITAGDIQTELFVPDAQNREALMKLKDSTPARIGIWRSGPRYNTKSLLRLRADHAAARDAVFTTVSEEFVNNLGIFSIKSMCKDKDEFLTRPDLGRKIDNENSALIRQRCKIGVQVQIIIADGLSSTAIEANARDVMATCIQGLKAYNIESGTPFFVKYARVPIMDVISEIVNSEVTIILIGERPGLVISESMSCYMAYRARVGMVEANRTVISNIHKKGTPAIEAGAYIADVVKRMLEEKISGVNLKL